MSMTDLKKVKIDFQGKPKATLEELNKNYRSNTLLIISEVFSTPTVYTLVLQDMIDIMKYGFGEKEIRSRLIYFKFNKKDKEQLSLSIPRFISNLIFWQPLIKTNRAHLLDKSWIFDFSTFNTKTLISYVDNKLLPVLTDISFKTKNALIDDLYYNIVAISHAFCLLLNMGISIYDMWQFEQRVPEAGKLMRDDIDDTLSATEMEEELSKRTDRMIELILSDPEINDLKPFFASGNTLKPGQFREYTIRIGFKADINGHTIPIFINNNFLLHGLDRPSYSYINALSGRKAVIFTKLGMAKPGAAAKRIVMSSLSSVLRKDDKVCDSIATLDYHIHDDDVLKGLHGRYYYDNHGNMQLLDHKRDKFLIGKIIRFRSPMTCNSKEGICRYCYGHLFDINKDMNSVGALAGLKVSGPIGQGTLSLKHNQTTSSATLSISGDFDEYFEVNSSNVYIREDSDNSNDITIRLNNIEVEEMDDSVLYYVSSFSILDTNNQESTTIVDDNGAKFYLSDKMISLIPNRPITAGMSPVCVIDDSEDEESLFIIEVRNKEVTEALKLITKVIGSNDHDGARTYSEFAAAFANRATQIGLGLEYVHYECILKPMIRKKSNILEQPEFSTLGDPRDYQIIKVNDSYLRNPSALVGMPAGYLRRQLLSTEFYEKRKAGTLDALYAEHLYKHI